MKVLIVDDDPMLVEFLRMGLREAGHATDVAATCAEGRTLALVHEFDAVILDYNLPDCTGLDVIRALRGRGDATPILMLTSRDSKESLIECLNAGADDYLVKPFVMGELLARVHALVRRGGATREERLQFGDVTVDRLTREARVGERELPLTPKEHMLLEHLLLHPRRIVTRTELLEKVWELHFDPGSNVVDVHVARLRAKLRHLGSALSIATVRGTGFILTDQPSAP